MKTLFPLFAGLAGGIGAFLWLWRKQGSDCVP